VVNKQTNKVTDKVHRTIKFLAAVCYGKFIVSYKWIDKCAKAAKFVDEKPYIVKDAAAERKYRFSLRDALDKARRQPLLASRTVYVTRNVQPPPADFAVVIVAAGGKAIEEPPSVYDDNTLILSCPEDKDEWQKLQRLGFTVYTAELLLRGALCQVLDLRSNKLA